MTEDILTVNELFSGIGAQRKALDRLGIAHEVVGVCEIDKYAIQSYEAIFGKTYNYGDICTVERLNYADLWTYSFPCQDISVAGRGKGISSETRSGLLYQVQRLLEVAKKEKTLPKYLLLENVKNLVGKRFKEQFFEWVYYLSELGYDTYWQVLNAKNYGIPQNRERVFAISIRKDLNQTFEFPKPEELKIRLKDILEDEVEEKYYISNDKVQNLIKTLENKEISNTIRAGGRGSLDRHQWDLVAIGASRGRYIENKNSEQRLELNIQGTSNTITTVQKDNYVVEIANPVRLGNIYGEDKGTGFAGNVWDKKAISPTLTTMQGGNREPKIVIGSTQKNAYIGDGEFSPTLTSAMGMGGGHVPMVGFDEKIIIDDTQQGFNGIRCYQNYAPTLRASRYGLKTTDGIRIRKLTPLECWRLMGFDDEDFRKAEASGVSNSQLYKQAGNSIVVNVLEKIFENLCK